MVKTNRRVEKNNGRFRDTPSELAKSERSSHFLFKKEVAGWDLKPNYRSESPSFTALLQGYTNLDHESGAQRCSEMCTPNRSLLDENERGWEKPQSVRENLSAPPRDTGVGVGWANPL